MLKMNDMKEIVNNAPLFLGALLLVFVPSCSEKIDLELENIDSRVVIDARITDTPEGNRVLLSQTTGFLAEEPAVGLGGAMVMVSSGKRIWHLKEKNVGEYVMPDDFKGEAENTYTLEVDTGEEIYQSVSELKAAVEVDSMLIRPHPWISDHHELVVHFQDPPGQLNFYMWKVYKNGVLLTDSLRKLPFTDSEAFSGRYVRAPVYILQPEDGIPQPGDKIRVEQYRIAEDYFHFLVAARRNQGAAGGPFVGPPSNVPTNIKNGALGFFMTASVTSREMIVN